MVPRSLRQLSWEASCFSEGGNLKLSQLHESFIDQARRPMDFGKLPVSAVSPETPIIPVNKWVKSVDTWKKDYTFRLNQQRNDFVKSILDYEAEVGHNAVVHVKEGCVTLFLSTHDIGITELDKEYAKHADELYRDVVYSLKHGT
jgi:pterin-4a-carbinolamine dehydratase